MSQGRFSEGGLHASRCHSAPLRVGYAWRGAAGQRPGVHWMMGGFEVGATRYPPHDGARSQQPPLPFAVPQQASSPTGCTARSCCRRRASSWCPARVSGRRRARTTSAPRSCLRRTTLASWCRTCRSFTVALWTSTGTARSRTGIEAPSTLCRERGDSRLGGAGTRASRMGIEAPRACAWVLLKPALCRAKGHLSAKGLRLGASETSTVLSKRALRRQGLAPGCCWDLYREQNVHCSANSLHPGAVSLQGVCWSHCRQSAEQRVHCCFTGVRLAAFGCCQPGGLVQGGGGISAETVPSIRDSKVFGRLNPFVRKQTGPSFCW